MFNPIEISVQVGQSSIEVQTFTSSVEASIPIITLSETGVGENSTVTGFNGIYELEIAPGANIVLPNAQIVNSDTTPLFGIDPGETKISPDGILKDSEGEVIISIPSGATRGLNDISVTEVNGEVRSEIAQRPVICAFSPIRLLDFKGNLIDKILEYQIDYTLPDPRNEILFNRIIPNQWESYRPGDIGAHKQAGTFNYPYSDDKIGKLQRLNYAEHNSDGHYRLVFNNEFGNNYRFTDSLGNPPVDGRARFDSFPSGALEGYIIDHYRGIDYLVLFEFFGNWNDNITNIFNSTKYGYDDWFPLSYFHLLDVLNPSVAWDNNLQIFRYLNTIGTAPTFIWGGSESVFATANSFRLRETTGIVETVGKTATNLYMFAARNRY